MYTREGNTTRLDHARDLGLDLAVLGALLARLSPVPSLVNFVTPLVAYAPMCSNRSMWTRMLRELPTLDDIDIIAR
jgi:hypothetical protein